MRKGNEQYRESLELSGKQRERKLKNAVELYNQALTQNPKLAFAWFNRGLALGGLRKYSLAVESYNIGLQFKPEDVPALFHKVNMLYELKLFDKAIECYDKAMTVRPAYVDLKRLIIKRDLPNYLKKAIAALKKMRSRKTSREKGEKIECTKKLSLKL